MAKKVLVCQRLNWVQIFFSPKTIEFLRQDNRINKIVVFLLINKLKSCKNI